MIDEFFVKVIVSLLIGALVGIEREHRSKGKIFAGFRSFMLVSLFGLLTGWLSKNFSHLYSFINLIILGSLVIVSHWIKYKKRKFSGVTTEIAFLLTFLIGFILFFDTYPYILSIFLVFTLTAVLYAKETLHEIAYKATSLEIRDIIIFVLIAFVIFPLLPDAYIDPWHAFNPRIMWKGIVIILGLSYFSYLMFKIFKAKGLRLNSFFTGLVNSMYVSYEYSYYFNRYPIVKYLLLIAISSMILRAFILGSLINPSISLYLSPLLISSACGYAIGFMKAKNKKRIYVRVKSPLSFKFAVFYGIFFSAIVFISKIVSEFFGPYGIYVLSAIVGLVDVSSLTIALSTMNLPPLIISRAILILTTMNVIGNWLMTLIFGNKKFSKEAFKVESILLVINSIILTSTFLF